MNTTKTVAPAPRAVMVVTDKQYRGYQGDSKMVSVLESPDSLVVPYSESPTVQSERVLAMRSQLIASDRLEPGRLLVRNPYDRVTYEFAEEAIEVFLKEKYYSLATIVAYLGASEIAFEKVEIEKEKQQIGVKAAIAGGAKAVAAGADFSRALANQLEKRFEAKTTLAGQPADNAAARQFMMSRGLAADPDIRGLIELCETGNAMRSHRVKMNGLRESTSSLKVGLELTSALGVGVAGNGAFEKAV